VSAQVEPEKVPVDVGRPALKRFVETNPRTVVNLVKQSNGLYKFRYGNSGSSNVDDLGIYWQFSTVGLGGQLAVVQVMTAGLYVYVDSNDVYHSALGNASFPLVDNPVGSASPWYNGQGNPLEGSDSPSFEFPSAPTPEGCGMTLSFTDYVVYDASGDGTPYDFVPIANFSWSLSVAYYFVGPDKGWKIYSEPSHTPVTLSPTFPTGINCCTYFYNTWNPPS
jgi:hypothetical protein